MLNPNSTQYLRSDIEYNALNKLPPNGNKALISVNTDLVSIRYGHTPYVTTTGNGIAYLSGILEVNVTEAPAQSVIATLPDGYMATQSPSQIHYLVASLGGAMNPPLTIIGLEGYNIILKMDTVEDSFICLDGIIYFINASEFQK